MCVSFELYGDLKFQMLERWYQYRWRQPVARRVSESVDILQVEQDQVVQSRFPWGLKTDWSKRLLVNARIETIEQKSTFRQAYQQRRCLIPVSAWHEWRDEGGPRKQKYRLSYDHKPVFLMAGIWYPSSEHTPEGALISLTCAPSEMARTIHPRMPLLLRDPAGYLQGQWDPVRAVRELHLGDRHLLIEALPAETGKG